MCTESAHDRDVQKGSMTRSRDVNLDQVADVGKERDDRVIARRI